MADTIKFDTSQLDAVAAGWRAKSATLMPKLKPTFSKAGLNIKNRINEDLKASRNAGIARVRVTYDVTASRSAIGLEVGPDKAAAPVNALGNIAFFGTARGGGTHLFYEQADPEIPTLQKFVEEIAAREVADE